MNEPKAFATESPHDRVIPTGRIADRGRARLPELLTIVVLVVGAGAAVFWIDYEAKRARKESEARLEGIIAAQAERIASLERDMSTVKDAFGQLDEVLPAAFKAIGERLNSTTRLATQPPTASRSSEASPTALGEQSIRTAPLPRAPAAQKTENFFLEATRPASLPPPSDQLPGRIPIESIQTPALRRAAEQAAAGQRRLEAELRDDFTDKTLTPQPDDIYSKGFKNE